MKNLVHHVNLSCLTCCITAPADKHTFTFWVCVIKKYVFYKQVLVLYLLSVGVSAGVGVGVGVTITPDLKSPIVCDCMHGQCDSNCSYVLNEQTCTAECQCKAAIALVDESDDNEEHEVTCSIPNGESDADSD